MIGVEKKIFRLSSSVLNRTFKQEKSIFVQKTIEDVIELAKQVFRLRFTGEWEFYVESPYNKYRGKLEINV
ncbi:hypothetical protein NXX02_21140 [Bacteroides fragilis]|nr:hypothetical protein [Bacteroides fragilis]